MTVFIELDEALEVHRDQIERHGGVLGVRDMGLLESALAMPRTGFGGEYLHTDLFQMAAAYLYHVVKNHPFLDGNKRVGAAISLVFLELNGYESTLTNRQLVETVLAVAEGKLEKPALAEILKRRSRPIEP